MRLPLIVLALALSGAAHAQPDQDHAAHHPDGASAPAAVAPKPSAKAPTGKAAPGPASSSGGMDGMHQMHDRMHGAPPSKSSAHKSTSRSRSASAPVSSPMSAEHMQQMHEQMHGSSTNGQMKSMPPGTAASR